MSPVANEPPTVDLDGESTEQLLIGELNRVPFDFTHHKVELEPHGGMLIGS